MSNLSIVLPRAPAWALLILLATATSPAAKPAVGWIDTFQRYAAQEDIQQDSRYSAPPGLGLRWQEVLKSLPPPAEWERLHLQLESAVRSHQPGGRERERLQAAAWLLAYLRGQRTELLASLPRPGEDSPPSLASFAIVRLREALAPEPLALPLEEQVKLFREQIAHFEPVDVAALKQAIGGEENFARLERLIAGGRSLQQEMMRIYAEFEQTEDEAVARQKMEAAQEKYHADMEEDARALEPYHGEPLFGRYVATVVQEMPDGHAPHLELPDLVTVLGAAEAEALLRRTMRLNVRLGVGGQSGEATVRLARDLVLAGVAELRAPWWGLAHDTGADRVFEALHERFGDPDAGDHEFLQARGYYLAALIGAGRVDEAVQLSRHFGAAAQLGLPYDVMDALQRGGRAEALWQFLREWVARHPASPEWDLFTRLSAQLDRQEEMKAHIRRLAEEGAFAGMARIRVQRLQAGVELAADDLAAAIPRIQTLVATPADTPEERDAQMELCGKLADLADLLGDQRGLAGAFAAAEAIRVKARAAGPAGALGVAAKLATDLNRLGRHADAERVCRDTLAEAMKLRMSPAPADGGHDLSPHETGRLAAEQLRALTAMQRWPEAALLLQQSPWWGAVDVGDLLERKTVSDGVPLGRPIAQVLLHQHQPELARQILEAQLVVTPNVDAVYRSYLELVGQEAAPLLATLAATDRYEERPLIWQARLHLDNGEHDRAVAVLEAAIAIDPSDGEQGPGDRMRAYVFLAEAVAARGDAEKEAFLHGVMRAIRQSETADRWFAAGAYSRAIAIYRESLGFFQDAYCIQSRLAVRLAEEGRMDEAAEHYRRAFELMPDSFGRVESHCFGCEHVFAGAESQGAAELVFQRLLAARPEKPQLHYLLGYLREEQKRSVEAAAHYRDAVRLDPLYLNAWNKLRGLEQQLNLTPQERDDLMLKLLELDPAGRHVSPDLARVSNLSRLWQELATANRRLAGLPATTNLWKLEASAAEVPPGGNAYFAFARRKLGREFSDVLGGHRFIDALQQYLAALNSPSQQN